MSTFLFDSQMLGFKVKLTSHLRKRQTELPSYIVYGGRETVTGERSSDETTANYLAHVRSEFDHFIGKRLERSKSGMLLMGGPPYFRKESNYLALFLAWHPDL